MDWITVMLAAGVSLALAGLSIWLVGPLSDVVRWLESADGAAPPPPATRAAVGAGTPHHAEPPARHVPG